jgi:hypothetical protein
MYIHTKESGQAYLQTNDNQIKNKTPMVGSEKSRDESASHGSRGALRRIAG